MTLTFLSLISVECSASDLVVPKHGYLQWTPTRPIVGRDFRLYYSTPRTEHFAELWVAYESLEVKTVIVCEDTEIEDSNREVLITGLDMRNQFSFDFDLMVRNYSKIEDGDKDCLIRLINEGYSPERYEIDLISNEGTEGGLVEIN